MDSQRFRADRWTERLFRDHERRHAYDGQTGEAFRSWQASFRADLRSVLGFDAIEAAGVPDLDPRRIDSKRESGYERQKWTIQTETGLKLPFYLLVPDEPDPPYPVAVVAHGHSDLGKDLAVGRYETDEQRAKIVEDERDIGVQAVERGYATLVPDMRAMGELDNPADEELGYRQCHTMQLHAQLFGRTLAGDRAWDVTRLLDFAERRSALDDGRVVLTGHSGGGAVTLFAAAVDERVDVAAVSSYFCTFEDSIAAIDHCECNYVPGILGLGEMADVAGLIAPRPFVAVSGDDDPIFPIDGVRTAFDSLREIYENAGAADRCELWIGDGGHRFFSDGVWPFVDERL